MIIVRFFINAVVLLFVHALLVKYGAINGIISHWGVVQNAVIIASTLVLVRILLSKLGCISIRELRVWVCNAQARIKKDALTLAEVPVATLECGPLALIIIPFTFLYLGIYCLLVLLEIIVINIGIFIFGIPFEEKC